MATNGFDKRPEDINKKGRPKKEWTWSHIFEEEVEKLDDKNKEKIKYVMAKKMIDKVIEGDVQAFKEIANRMDGMPRQNIGLDGGEDGKPIEAEIKIKAEKSIKEFLNEDTENTTWNG